MPSVLAFPSPQRVPKTDEFRLVPRIVIRQWQEGLALLAQENPRAARAIGHIINNHVTTTRQQQGCVHCPLKHLPCCAPIED